MLEGNDTLGILKVNIHFIVGWERNTLRQTPMCVNKSLMLRKVKNVCIKVCFFLILNSIS